MDIYILARTTAAIPDMENSKIFFDQIGFDAKFFRLSAKREIGVFTTPCSPFWTASWSLANVF
jgi:hypothetical protein